MIPVACAGGVAGLAVLNLFLRQPLDMLTMLGFVILTGIVVNNAILLIEQTVLHINEDNMAVSDSIIEATQNRIRPIFMSTLTSLFDLCHWSSFLEQAQNYIEASAQLCLAGWRYQPSPRC